MSAEDYDIFWAELCCNNPDAYRFINAWNNYCHGIDDIIDGDLKDAEGITAIFLTAAHLYNSNFWTQHRDRLYPLVAGITSSYLDSVKLEKSNVEWEKQLGDVLRTSGNEMLMEVAEICGGWQHRRDMSLKLRALSYGAHHTKDGKVV